jgi:hypothetical protein
VIRKPVELSTDEDMTLSDIEAFCRLARQQGGTNDDVVRYKGTFRSTLRTLRVVLSLPHNREAAYDKDHRL